jgi:flagellar M-ring protein FliF
MAKLFEVWSRLTLNQRLLLGTVGGALVLGVVLSLVWARQPEYTVLYANLNPEDASQIVDQLRSKKVPFRLEDAGRTILVPTKSVYESRLDLAVQGLPESGIVGYEIFDRGGFGVTDFVQRLNYRRALEGEIGRTIQSLAEVRSARVHVVIPEETLFVEDQNEATASVVLRLKGSLSDEQVAGIVRLVSSSVEGLRPDNVTVVDTFGNLLSRPKRDDTLAGVSSDQLELKGKVESYLREKAVQMLEGVLGRGKVVAQVDARLDFEQVERTIETYDPESQVVRSEERIKGTAEGEGEKNEHLLTNYEISRTMEKIVAPVGGIKKLTVAVLVDGTYTEGPDGARQFTPRPDDEIARLTGIIRTAVGFDETRGDQLAVHCVPFSADPIAGEVEAMKKSDRFQLMFQVLNRVGQVLVILLLALFVRAFYRRTSTAVRTYVEQAREAPQTSVIQRPSEEEKYLRLQQQLVQLAHSRPDEVSRLVRTWLKED